jgi:hypothetical protein
MTGFMVVDVTLSGMRSSLCWDGFEALRWDGVRYAIEVICMDEQFTFNLQAN